MQCIYLTDATNVICTAFRASAIHIEVIMESAQWSWWRHQSAEGRNVAVPALCSLLAILVVVALYANVQQRKKLPPGPRGWPILGNLPHLTKFGPPHRSLTTLAAKYGGLMYLRLGSVPCIVVSTAAVAKELCHTNDAVFSSRPSQKLASIILNFGSTEHKGFSAAPYGPYWRQLRRFCTTELFSATRHASYERVRIEEIQNMMQALLEESRKGDAIDLKSWLYGANANNMTRMLIKKRYFNTGVEDEQQEKGEFQLMMADLFDMLGAFVISDYVPWLSFVTRLQGYHSRFEDVHNRKETIGVKLVALEKHREDAKKRELQQQENPEEEADYVPDFVDLLMNAPLDHGKLYADRDIVGLITGMFAAGTETSSTTTEWAMAEMMLHPHMKKKAQDELNSVVGPERLVQETDIPNLPYLQAFVKEVFRMHPPGPLSIPRESTQATELLGFKLPAKTMLLLNVYAIHRDPSMYTNPDVFDPDRFMEHPEVSAVSGFDSFQLLPFGFGRRMCPAYKLGNLMVTLLLAHLLHSFEWLFSDGEDLEHFDMGEANFALTVCRRTPLHLVAKPKAPAFLYETK